METVGVVELVLDSLDLVRISEQILLLLLKEKREENEKVHTFIRRLENLNSL